MTDFQSAAASLAILLEVFSEDASGASLESCAPGNTRDLLKQMRTRVAKGEFWELLGGLDSLEKQLREGFSETFNDPRYDENGQVVLLQFPEAVIGKLFTELRSCGSSELSLDNTINPALPVLRGFVAEKFSP